MKELTHKEMSAKGGKASAKSRLKKMGKKALSEYMRGLVKKRYAKKKVINTPVL